MCRWWEEGRSQEEALAWLTQAFPQAPISWLQEVSAACARSAQGALREAEDLTCAPRLLLWLQLNDTLRVDHTFWRGYNDDVCVHDALIRWPVLLRRDARLFAVCTHMHVRDSVTGSRAQDRPLWHALVIFPPQVVHPVPAKD